MRFQITYFQKPMFEPTSDWKPTPVSDLPSWAGAKRVAIDCETCDPHLKKLGPSVRRGGFVAGVSFAIEDGPAYYLPIRHQTGQNLEEDLVWAYLRAQAAVFRGDLVGANLPYDLDYLAQQGGVWFEPRFFRDVQVAEPLINELQRGYSLAAIARRYDVPGKSEEALRAAAASYGFDPKSEMWRLPAKHVAEYAIQDVRLPLSLIRRQERIIEDQDLWGVYDLESRVLPILTKMRRRGVRVDLERLAQVETWAAAEELKALDEVRTRTGIRVAPEDVWVADAIAAPLKSLGFDIPETPTGQPSTRADFLESLDHPVASALVRARKFNKLRTTFATSVRKHLVGDRIHCTLNQLRGERDESGGSGLKGAAYGRMSSTNPNMQQQPSPKKNPEIAGTWRQIYVPDEGKLWASCDYSQQEPRMLTHYATKLGLEKADQAAHRYREDPTMDNHQMMADMCGIDRDPAKIIYLGIAYGMGGGKLCTDLGLPTEWRIHRRSGKKYLAAGPEGQALLDRFDAEAPFIRELARACEARAKDRGYITTLSGRRCRFPIDDMGRYDWTYKALNRLIQGASGDQTKMALVAVEEAGHEIQLQVHDELDLSVQSADQAQEVARIMEACCPLEIPSKVDVEIGDSWGTAK